MRFAVSSGSLPLAGATQVSFGHASISHQITPAGVLTCSLQADADEGVGHSVQAACLCTAIAERLGAAKKPISDENLQKIWTVVLHAFSEEDVPEAPALFQEQYLAVRGAHDKELPALHQVVPKLGQGSSQQVEEPALAGQGVKPGPGSPPQQENMLSSCALHSPSATVSPRTPKGVMTRRALRQATRSPLCAPSAPPDVTDEFP